MQFKKKEKILLGVLFGVITFFLVDQFVLSPKKVEPIKAKNRTGYTPKSGQKGSEPPIVEANSFSLPMIRKRNNESIKIVSVSLDNDVDTKQLLQWHRDPFLGIFTADVLDSIQGTSESSLVLKAISWRDSVAYVIINEDVYREGETKNGIHVLDVIGNKVIFTRDGERNTLSLGE